jgi:hypothetical protein
MWARNGRWILPEIPRLPRSVQGSFTCRKSTTWDRRLYFPSEGRRGEDFFALKNPTASAGFEPANLDTKGQHATSRPPKLLTHLLTSRHDFTLPLPHLFSRNAWGHTHWQNEGSQLSGTPKRTFTVNNALGGFAHVLPVALKLCVKSLSVSPQLFALG